MFIMRRKLRPPTLVHCPDIINKLMQDCWAEEMDERPTMAQITLRILDINAASALNCVHDAHTNTLRYYYDYEYRIIKTRV